MLASDKVRIQYSSKYSGSSNYWKFSIGQSQGLKRLKIKEKKQKLEDMFREWTDVDPVRKQKYGEALDLIKTSIEAKKEYGSGSFKTRILFQYLFIGFIKEGIQLCLINNN